MQSDSVFWSKEAITTGSVCVSVVDPDVSVSIIKVTFEHFFLTHWRPVCNSSNEDDITPLIDLLITGFCGWVSCCLTPHTRCGWVILWYTQDSGLISPFLIVVFTLLSGLQDFCNLYDSDVGMSVKKNHPIFGTFTPVWPSAPAEVTSNPRSALCSTTRSTHYDSHTHTAQVCVCVCVNHNFNGKIFTATDEWKPTGQRV